MIRNHQQKMTKLNSNFKCILFDLDMTIIDSSKLLYLRKKRRWDMVYKQFDKTTIFDGLKTILEKLAQKYQTGIVTSSPRKYASKLINYHNLDIEVLTAFHDTRHHKPHPEPILNALLSTGSRPEEAVYIGDDVTDIIASKNAGVTSVAAVWGANDKIAIKNCNPDILLSTPNDIITNFLK